MVEQIQTVVPLDDEMEKVRALGRQCIEHGFAFPDRVLSATEAQECLFKLQDYEQQCGGVGSLQGDDRFKIHLLLPWAWDLVHHPAVVELACACLGTRDVWCWSTDVNAKEPLTKTHFTWHQDSTYAGITPPGHAVTIWLALTPSKVESGCLRCIPSSHVLGQLPHVQGQEEATDNALALQQEIVNLENIPNMDPQNAKTMVLEPGEASVHSFWTVHSSSANTTSHRRIGLAMRFVSAHASKAGKVQEYATLVSGSGSSSSEGEGGDRNAIFQPEVRPVETMGLTEKAAHAAAMALERANYLPQGGTTIYK
jgi:non-heme Fe2+,alpha-ketoglutarate-dependent halogenase